MAESIGRVRTMVKPLKKSGVVTAGRFRHRTYSMTSSGLTFLPWVNSAINTDFIPTEKFKSAKVTRDQTNPGPPYRSGGNFFSRSYTNEYEPSSVLGTGKYQAFTYIPETGTREILRTYEGGFQSPGDATFQWDNKTIPELINESHPFVPDLTALGNQGFNRLKPKLQKASGFIFLAEARDIPRMLDLEAQAQSHALAFGHALGGLRISNSANFRSRLMWEMGPKKAADDFLAVQFGWAPFVKDVLQLLSVVENYAAYLDALVKNNDKPIRRRVTLFESHESVEVNHGSGYPAFMAHQSNGESDWFSSIPTWSITSELYTRAYAVGRFKYYRPELDKGLRDFRSQANRIRRFMLMFGLRVSPINIYRSIPWTWLIDWFTRFGDNISLLTDTIQDSIICDYCYVMQHTVEKRTYLRTLPFRTGTVRLAWSRILETKARQPASSPYGFSLPWDGLTPRQIAILGALGISRQRWLGGP